MPQRIPYQMLIPQELIRKHTNYAKMSKLYQEFEIAGCERNRFTPQVKSSPALQFFSTHNQFVSSFAPRYFRV
jgi:hypothetical protein